MSDYNPELPPLSPEALSEIDRDEALLERALGWQDRASNRATQWLANVAVTFAAARLNDTQEHVGLAIQVQECTSGRQPMVED